MGTFFHCPIVNAQVAIGDRSIGGKFTEPLRAEECYDLGIGGNLADAPEYVRDAFRQMQALVERA